MEKLVNQDTLSSNREKKIIYLMLRIIFYIIFKSVTGS